MRAIAFLGIISFSLACSQADSGAGVDAGSADAMQRPDQGLSDMASDAGSADQGVDTGGPDIESPFLTSVSPMDGTVVAPGTIEIEAFFSEPMDESEVDLTVTTTGIGAGGFAIRQGDYISPILLRLSVEISAGQAVRVDFTELRDRAGNPVDRDIELTDGMLTLTTP